MNSTGLSLAVLLGSGVVTFGACLLARRRFPGLSEIDIGPWSSTLSYVATAYGVIIGFSILLLFGQFAAARQAVGDEATSIGTAYEEARLFGDSSPEIQSALICYAQAVPTYEWPAMRDRGSAPEVDRAYRQVVLALGDVDQAADAGGTFQPAAATNIVVQVGNISTAREERLVAAENQVPPMLWALLVGGGLFVLVLIFVVTAPARPVTQAVLVSLSAMFTTVMVVLVFALSTPFLPGNGRVQPKLIEQTTEAMVRAAPEAAQLPCAWKSGS